VESQTNTPPDQLSEAQIFQNTSSALAVSLCCLGLKRIVAIKMEFGFHYRLIHHLKEPDVLKIAIPSPILETDSLTPFPWLRQPTLLLRLR
jgi:hypothetical protein